MANYVYIENNNIQEYHDLLPKNWRNISGFYLLENDQNYLKSLGWYKVIKNQEIYDPSFQKITRYDYSFTGNEVYETPIIENFIPNPPAPPPIPQQISATQLRLWLIKHNIPLINIENAINSIEDTMLKEELMVRWEYVPYFERSNIFINQIGFILGLTPEQINQAFIEASKYI